MSKLNPWLREKLKGVDPENISVIVEVDPKYFDEVYIALRNMGLEPKNTAFHRFIEVEVPDPSVLEYIERIPGVVEIHYNMPRTIGLIKPPSLRDPFLGQLNVSKVEIPGLPTILGIPLPGLKKPGVQIIPTIQVKGILVDIDTDLTGSGVKACVIDTGATPWHPQLLGSRVELYSTVPEAPFDFMGHGQWCSDMVYGRELPSRFGRITGIAPGASKCHVKALTTAGFGTSMSIIKALEIALDSGAKIVSMSLGGEQQGPVDSDPEVKATRILAENGVIIVAAAGNSGPDKWTINSPGVSPWVLTVGSVSIMDDFSLSWFSSRGPQGSWYVSHKSDYEEDLVRYGDDLIKPDIVSLGGGRANRTDSPDEVLYQGITGWFDGFYDLAIDGAEGMHGTSQATPSAAGLLALIAEAYPEVTIGVIKRGLARIASKNEYYGYGIVKLSMLKEAVKNA